MTRKIKNIPAEWLLMAVYAIGLLLLASCKGCNKSEPVTPSAVQVIEKEAKPAIDSVIAVAKMWQSKYDSLAASFKAKEPTRKQSQSKLSQSLNDAKDIAIKQGCDSVLYELVETKRALDEYVQFTDEQLSTQGQMIEAKDSVAAAAYAQVELEQSKFKKLAGAYEFVDQDLSKTKKQLEKTDRKLKRAKFLNKVFIPGAIIMGSALGFIIL